MRNAASMAGESPNWTSIRTAARSPMAAQSPQRMAAVFAHWKKSVAMFGCENAEIPEGVPMLSKKQLELHALEPLRSSFDHNSISRKTGRLQTPFLLVISTILLVHCWFILVSTEKSHSPMFRSWMPSATLSCNYIS